MKRASEDGDPQGHRVERGHRVEPGHRTEPSGDLGPTVARHDAVRRANRIETAEDYVEAIDALVQGNGEARVRDLARMFGVSHVTVSRTLDRLRRDGYVSTGSARSLELTDLGVETARASRARHAVVLRFLLALGVAPESAVQDSEGIEHHVSPETLEVFAAFTQQRPLSSDLERVAEALLDTSTDSQRFRRVREAHSTELVEDYVEAIADFAAGGREVRVRDLAAHFGVSHVTVSRTIGRLQRDGFAHSAPYRPVHLTPKGEELARRSRERHVTVLRFLMDLGVPRPIAEVDAEGVEHHVSPPTLACFRDFTVTQAEGGEPADDVPGANSDAPAGEM